MTLLAADISSHNTITSWPAFLGSVDVVIPKISEGIGYVWSGAAAALGQARAAGKCAGAYHFYGGGSGAAEADYFLANYAWRPGEVPILDWEPTKPPADPDGVAAAFCQRVHDRLGVAPLVYMSGSAARSQAWTRTRAASCGLWVAQYDANTGQPGTPPTVGSWGTWAGWQYTSLGTRPGLSGAVDLSTFTGDATRWRALGTPGGTMATADDVWNYTIPARNGVGPATAAAFLGYTGDFVTQLLAVEKANAAKLDALTTAVAQLAQAVAAAPGMTCQGNPQAVLSALGEKLATPTTPA